MSQDNIGKPLEEGVEEFLNFLEDYVNEDATMNEAQADTLMSDIVQWHQDQDSGSRAPGFIAIATYINSCR